MEISITEEELKVIFNKWMLDYRDNPETFEELGVYTDNYAENCTKYFLQTYLVIKQGEVNGIK